MVKDSSQLRERWDGMGGRCRVAEFGRAAPDPAPQAFPGSITHLILCALSLDRFPSINPRHQPAAITTSSSLSLLPSALISLPSPPLCIKPLRSPSASVETGSSRRLTSPFVLNHLGHLLQASQGPPPTGAYGCGYLILLACHVMLK